MQKIFVSTICFKFNFLVLNIICEEKSKLMEVVGLKSGVRTGFLSHATLNHHFIYCIPLVQGASFNTLSVE
jgi:hypothetical protein